MLQVTLGLPDRDVVLVRVLSAAGLQGARLGGISRAGTLDQVHGQNLAVICKRSHENTLYMRREQESRKVQYAAQILCTSTMTLQ